MGGAFLGGISPRLVIGWEDAQITSGKGFIIGHVDQAVVSVEIGRDKDNVDLVLRQILQPEAVARLQNRIRGFIMKAVRAYRGGPCFSFGVIALQGRNQIRMAAQDKQIDKDRLIAFHFLFQAAQGVKKDIDALVMKFISPGYRDDLGVAGQVFFQKPAGGFQEPHPGSQSGTAVLDQVRDLLHIQAIGGNHVRIAPEKILRLQSGNVTDRCEAARFPGRSQLHGIFRRNIVGICFPHGRDMIHGGIDVHPRSSQGPSQNRRMGCKDRPDFRNGFFQKEQSRTGHPLMKLGNRCSPLGTDHEIVDGLDDFSTGVTEHDGFGIIPSACDGIHAIIFPHPVKKLILVVLQTEIDEDDFRLAGDPPAPETTGQVLDGRSFPNLIPTFFVGFLKVKIGFKVRSEEIIILSINLHGFPDLAADHGIDSADLVAYLPAAFKEISVFIFVHFFQLL
ncbi:MAG: hypothetical protein A4E72_01517 [Syntrophus sp. PtaU1.Bin208]|nr:MAG: hypothetical protein A4E72_01517 [Syntrophus sp. PtaU1.Bin208]